MKICSECCQSVIDDNYLYDECPKCNQERLQVETEVLCQLEYKYLNEKLEKEA